ncbi:MAG: hypothetical protein ACE5QF_01745 [Thermoplasmata archaeon]
MDMMQETAGPPPYPAGPVVEKTAKPVIGGILIIIGALAGIIGGAMMIWAGSLFLPIPTVGFDLGGIFAICGIIWILLSLIGILGGVFAMQRKHFGLAIVGGIFSLLFGFFIFGLIGLILVAISKNEFT